MSNKLAATFHGSGPCKKSCCWTPYTCATSYQCEHHREHAREQARAEWIAEADRELQQLSDQAMRDRR